MTRTINEIIEEMQGLLDELRSQGTDGGKASSAAPSKKQSLKKNEFSGCMGGLQMLVRDGYFDEPRTRQDITKKLAEEGRYYTPELISMNLTNLSKKGKALTRLGARGTYKFVARR